MNSTPEDFLRLRRGDASASLRAEILREIAEDGPLAKWLSDVQSWAAAQLPCGREYVRKTNSHFRAFKMTMTPEQLEYERLRRLPTPDVAQAIDDFLQYRRGIASDEVVARVRKSLHGRLQQVVRKALPGWTSKIPDLSGIGDRKNDETEHQRIERLYPELRSLLVINTPIDEIVEQLGLSRPRIEEFIRKSEGFSIYNSEIADSSPRGDSRDRGRE